MMMRPKSTTPSQILDSQVEMSMSMNLGVKSINVKPKTNLDGALKKKKPLKKQQPTKKKTPKNGFLGSTTELLQFLARNIAEPSQRTHAFRAIQRVPSKLQGSKREPKANEPNRRRSRRKSDTQELANILASYMIAQTESFNKKQSEHRQRRNSLSPPRTNKRLKSTQNAECDLGVQQNAAKTRCTDKNENVRLPLVVPKETLLHKTQSKLKSHTTTDHSPSQSDVATTAQKEQKLPRKAKTPKPPKAEAEKAEEEMTAKKPRRSNTPVAIKEPALQKVTKIPVLKGEIPSSASSNKDIPRRRIAKVASREGRTPSPPSNKAQRPTPKPQPKEEKQPQTPKKARRIDPTLDTPNLQKKPSTLKKKESKQLFIQTETKKQLTAQCSTEKKKQPSNILKKSSYSLQMSTRTSSDSTLRSLTLSRSDYSMSSEPGTADLNLRKLNEIVTNFKEEITHVVQHTSNNNSQSSKRSSSSKKRKARCQHALKTPLAKKKSLIPVLKKIKHAKAIEPSNIKQEGVTKRPATGDGTRQKKHDNQNLDGNSVYSDMVLTRAQTNPPLKAKPIEDVVKRRKSEVKADKEVSKPKPRKIDEAPNKKPKKGKSVKSLRTPSEEFLIDLQTPSYADSLAEYRTIADNKLRFKSKSAANIEKKLLELKSSRSQGMVPKVNTHKKDSDKKEQNKSKNTNAKNREDKLDTKQVNEITEKQSIKFGDQMDILKTLHGNIQAMAQSNESLTSGILAASKYDITIESFVKFTQEQLSQFQKPFGQLEVQKSDASTTTLDRFKLIRQRSHQASQTDFKLVMVDSASTTDIGPMALTNDEYVEQGMDLAKRGLTKFFSIVQTINKADLVPKLNENTQLIGDTCALSFNVDEDVTRSKSNINNNTTHNMDKILLNKLVKVEQYLNMVMYYYRLALETKHSLDDMVKSKMPAIGKAPPSGTLDSIGLYKVRKSSNLCKQLSRIGSQSMEYHVPQSVNVFNAAISRISFDSGVYDVTEANEIYRDGGHAMENISFGCCENEEETPQISNKTIHMKESSRKSKRRRHIHAIIKKKVASTTSQKSLTKISPLDKILSLITKNYIPEEYTDKLSKALHLFKLCITQPSIPQKKSSPSPPQRCSSIIELKRIYAGHQIHMAAKDCECKDQGNLLGEALEDNFSSSKKNIFDDEEEDDHYEHYLHPLTEPAAAVHYDQTNPTGSTLSLPPVQVETDMCFDETRMEIPWLSITLPPPGSLIIKGKEGFCLRKPICDCWRMYPEESECQESPPPELFTGRTCKCRDGEDEPSHSPPPSSPPPNTTVSSMESGALPESQPPADSEAPPAESEAAPAEAPPTEAPPVTEAPSEETAPPAEEEKFEFAVEEQQLRNAEIEEVPSNCICVDHVSKDMKDCTDIKPLEFVYDNAFHSYYEPYMDSWYCDFPDEMDTPCGPNTEIPWHELLVPRNVKLKAKQRPKRGPEGDPNMAMVKVGKNEMEKYSGKPPEAFEIKLSFAEFVETRGSGEKKGQGVTPKSSKASRGSKQVCACFESSGKKRHHHRRHRSSKRSKDKGSRKHSSHHKKIPHGSVSQRSSRTKKGSHHKSKAQKGNYKAEIISALDTCEAEMAPIRNALNDLKAKIQNITASAIDVNFEKCRSVASGVGCGAPMPAMMPSPMGMLPGMGSTSMGYNVPQIDSIPTFSGIGPPPGCGMCPMGPLSGLLGPPPPQHGPLGPPLPSPYGPPPFIAPKETSSTNMCKCRRKMSDKNPKGGGGHKHHHHHERH